MSLWDVAISAGVVLPALGLCIRLALRPVIDSLSRLQDMLAAARDLSAPALETEVRRLREETDALRAQLETLRASETFYRQLAAPQNSERST